MTHLDDLVRQSGSGEAGAEANIGAGVEREIVRLPTRAENTHFGNIGGLHPLSPRGYLSSKVSSANMHGEEHCEGVAPNRIRVETAVLAGRLKPPSFDGNVASW